MEIKNFIDNKLAQLLCALSGGKLIQHVVGHSGDHMLQTHDNHQLRVNSIHHQMMFPYTLPKNDYKVLGWSRRPLSRTYLDGNNKENWLPNNFRECEIVKFNKTQSFAVQFHPEMMHYSSEYRETNDWLGQLFLNFYNNVI